MSKINILPAKVFNRIAAGEVVDRPYSVVKELVENSIDAGATEIEIYIEQGGKQLVRVVDNGCGIEREDLQSAFLPHATSKISKAEDLENIFTLGFRGEAVASIASVSKMTIVSRVEGENCYQLTSDAGVLSGIMEATGAKGTDVRVEGLFYNTPVRLKFLKSDKAEETDITTFVSRFILNRPDIAFTYYVNGKKTLQSFGGGDEEALVSVYGAAIMQRLYKIDATRNGLRIWGYIGDQNFYKPNKSYQSVFLNGRYILNGTITSAVSGAYAAYLMKRQYPFYVLHIQVPAGTVDVNVHPNKADVRFADNQVVYGTIYRVISGVLDGQSKALEYVVSKPSAQMERTEEVTFDEHNVSPSVAFTNSAAPSPYTSISEQILQHADNEKTERKPSASDSVFGFSSLTYEEAQKEIRSYTPLFGGQEKKQPTSRFAEVEKDEQGWIKGVTPIEDIPDYVPQTDNPYYRQPIFQPKHKKDPEKLHQQYPNLFFERVVLEVDDPAYERKNTPALAGDDVFAANKRYLEELDTQAKQNKIDVSTCIFVGKLFNTYLLYQQGTDVYIVDQHAAHERLIFDRLKKQMQYRDVSRQSMLYPYELKLNAFEATFIRERLNQIREIGFDIQESGDTNFKITAVPTDLRFIDIGMFFNEILGDVSGYRAIKLEEILKDKLASAACKAAVKGGMELSRGEIDALLLQMDGDMGLKCPHGRPVVVKMTKTQLEKMFKRIV